MWQGLKILFIDDHKKNHDEFKLILNFMGKTCVCTHSDCYSQYLQTPETWLAIVLGNILGTSKSRETKVQAIIDEVNQLKHALPLIVFIHLDKQSELKDSEIYKHFVGKIIWPTQYVNLLDVLHRCQLFHKNFHPLNKQTSKTSKYRTLVGSSQAIRQVRHLIDQVAQSEATVLILGESGTGKEVVAQHVHEHSKRSCGPFVPVNCGAIPADLLESELFGHEKGAFTGAISARQGRFELASGGTLFLDEIGDMPLNMQVKLLRVLQERTFERVGGSKLIAANVRIIAATHCNLEKAIQEHRFREDLYYRLNVFPIELPALSDRREDIPMLINDLLARLELEGKGTIQLMPRATVALCQYHWPGNIRELANLIERLVILYPQGMVDLQDLPKKFCTHNESSPVPDSIPSLQTHPWSLTHEQHPQLPEQGIDLKKHLHQLESKYIEEALRTTNGTVSRAAEYLKMRRTTLVEKMKKYGIARNESETNE